MYQLLLTYRYLFSKVMPLLASLGVMLCTAVVLVTWSVMGGFLNMLINTGRTMTGDVAIRWSGAGLPHYQDLIDRLQASPGVDAAAPAIEAFGMISLPDGSTKGVMIRGIDGPSYERVTRFRDILWWRPIERALPKDTFKDDPRLHGIADTSWADILQNGRTLSRRDSQGVVKPGVVLGIHVSGMNRRLRTGVYVPMVRDRKTASGTLEEVESFLPRDGSVTITMLPLDSKGIPLDPISRRLPVCNEFQSGVFDFDANVVLVNLEVAQHMLRMQAVEAPAAPAPSGESFAGGTQPPAPSGSPARVTDVLVKGKGAMRDPAEARELRRTVERVYGEFAKAHPDDVPEPAAISIMTWEEQNATFINAVRNEISLLLILFSFLSLTVIFLVIAIFWSMVREKTMDIGVLRAVGAGRRGVAALWLAYGLAIGVVGSGLGLALAYALVMNINPIHDWLGEALHIVVWDPQVYYFTKIPNEVEPSHAALVVAGGVLSCVIGALIPALRAAWMHPVRALRNE